MTQKGFTLIELLVVIVIIGILATISVATFSGYFAQARDTERQAAVRNAATILKTAIAVNDPTVVPLPTDEATLEDALIATGQFTMPVVPAGDARPYAMVQDGTEFAIFVCSEENAGEIFADGTATAVNAVRDNAATFCPAPPTATSIVDALDINGSGSDETPFIVSPTS